MQTAIINPRLKQIAEAVREESVFADIGCDHGHLSIYLMTNRKAKRGYACDVNLPPLTKARCAIKKAGLEEKIETRLTNGLKGLENCGITDITMAGMGGELISDILRESLKESEFLKDSSVRLVLQPMSREAVLRNFLAENGFCLLEETAVRSGKWVYSVMTVEYKGIKKSLTGYEAYAGLLPKWCGNINSEKSKNAEDRLLRTCIFLDDQARKNCEKSQELKKIAEQIRSNLT